jgi:hypothetical protein
MHTHHGKPNETKATGIGTVLLSMAAIALAGTVGTVGLIQQVGDFGPRVGDIVTFDPLDSMSRDMTARIAAIPADNRPGVACVLDVRAMHNGGGSVIIESRRPMTGYGLRVHWSGARSANDATDCGASAELLVNQEDMEVLAMAAGGFGVPASKHAGFTLAGTTDAGH